MIGEATRDLIAVEDSAMARHEAGSSPSTIEPERRATASVKLAYHSNRREALLKISEMPEDFITVAAQPLQSSPVLGALGTTAQLIPRDDNDREAPRRRSSLGWAFARQAAIATMIVRKGCESSVEARAAMSVAQRPLRTPTPPAASVLRPTGPVAEVKLVPPTKLAENRITAGIVKTKLHILASDQPRGYGAIASFNTGNTDQGTYTVPRTIVTNIAAAWATAFRTVSASAGTPVDAVVHDDRFVITTLPAFAGPDVHVYLAEGIIVDTNAETGTAVGVGDVTMEAVQAEVADATPTPLRRAIEAQSFRPAIVRWSRSQPPGDDPLPWFMDTTPIPALPSPPAGPVPTVVRMRLRSRPPRRHLHDSKASPTRLRA